MTRPIEFTVTLTVVHPGTLAELLLELPYSALKKICSAHRIRPGRGRAETIAKLLLARHRLHGYIKLVVAGP